MVAGEGAMDKHISLLVAVVLLMWAGGKYMQKLPPSQQLPSQSADVFLYLQNLGKYFKEVLNWKMPVTGTAGQAQLPSKKST